MGRDKRNEERAEHWTKMARTMMQTDAWRALPLHAQALYPWLKLEWHGPKSNNNGKICLSVRQAALCMECNPKTAGRAFHHFEGKGFIVQTEAACLGVKGEGNAPAYEITELSLPRSHTGRCHYKDWRHGHDFPVKTAHLNNPEGRYTTRQASTPNSEAELCDGLQARDVS